MTSSIHHVVADLAARLDALDGALKEAVQDSQSSSSGGGQARLDLSLRLAACNAHFQKNSLAPKQAAELAKKLDLISATLHPLLPSFASKDAPHEPEREIDADLAAQRYAVLKKRLSPESLAELTQLRADLKGAINSSFARGETTSVVADILEYNGPEEGCAGDHLKGFVDRAEANVLRAEALKLRLARAKMRYEALITYANKQMCIWDLEIEERERKARLAV